ncbi:hypothetical protein D3C72_2092080 [compost metagenome]
MPHRRQQQRIAVRRRFGHEVGADAATPAGLVFNNDCLPQRLGHVMGQQASHQVDRATRGERNNQRDRLAGIVSSRVGQRVEADGRGQRRAKRKCFDFEHD